MRKPARKPARPTRPRGTTADPVETARRVDTILRLRLDGGQFHDLAHYANDQSPEGTAARGGPPWNLDPPELWELIRQADELLVTRVDERRARAVALQLARRDALYLRAINAGDYGVALSILRDQATILGMYPQVAELRKLVKAQDQLIRELEANQDEPREVRSLEAGPGEAGPAEGEGDREAPGAAEEEDGRGGE